jgi:biotin carboxylase
MRVLLFSATTGYQLRSYDEAALRRGVEIVLATDRCHQLDDPWRDRAIAVRFYDATSSLEAIEREAATRGFTAVLSVGDRPTILAARAAARLGLAGNPVDAAEASVDKREARKRFASAGLIVPRHLVVPPGTEARDAARDERLTFPCVLKPTGLSGSRGVIRADTVEEFVAAAARIRSLLARPDIRAERAGSDDILVEEFVPGREYAVEGVLTRGSLHVFTIFDKPDPLDGPFFEETIYVTPSALGEAEFEEVCETVERGARALGLRHGPIHAELRRSSAFAEAPADKPAGIVLLEIASRPIGGLCSSALSFEGGASLEDVLLDHALGGDATRHRRERAASAVMMIPIPKRGVLKRVEGLDRARGRQYVTDVRITAKPDQLLEPLPEAGSYLGFIFASAPLPSLAERAVRDAHQDLVFTIDPALTVVPG